jgi:allophanate hydrolase
MSAISEKVREIHRLIRARGDDGVWLSLVPESEVLARAEALEDSDLPLRGLTFAVKDNIDLAGQPTTAACPEFSYLPEKNAFVVQRLIDSGAIAIGKTNLDQFATGLNGTRTPHTIPRNAYDSAFISGGSSSGSAIAVALGEVDFALGTDTAGSGRVPAAFNNLVGFKPTKGRWSNTGLVPACRSLDCITVFSKTLALAEKVDRVVAGFDREDPFSRREPQGFRAETKCLAVLPESQREFFGDAEYSRLYAEALARAEACGWKLIEFDYEPFLAAASLLYNGPWVAERHSAMRDFMENHAEAMHPVVRRIVEGAAHFSATQAFEASYRLAELIRHTEPLWAECDAMLLPTAGTIYRVEEMLADPVRLNSNLGRYTNFVNLMDLSGVSVPAGFRADGLPFGVTFIGPAWTEAKLVRIAGEFLGEKLPCSQEGIKLAVVGAHLRGQPLNRQLLELGSVFVEATHTAPNYRLYALPNTTPPKPGLVRATEGEEIELEVWALSEAAFGRFVAAIPAPLGIGTVELRSGEGVKGFLCEDYAIRGAEDISRFGGWRGYLAR